MIYRQAVDYDSLITLSSESFLDVDGDGGVSFILCFVSYGFEASWRDRNVPT